MKSYLLQISDEQLRLIEDLLFNKIQTGDESADAFTAALMVSQPWPSINHLEHIEIAYDKEVVHG